MSAHSLAFNCEDDKLESLNNLKNFLVTTQPQEVENVSFPEVEITEYTPSGVSILKKGCLNYIAGFVAKKIIKKTKGCSRCRDELIGDKEGHDNFIIEAKQYSVNALLFPNSNFAKLYSFIIFVLQQTLPQVCSKTKVKNFFWLF